MYAGYFFIFLHFLFLNWSTQKTNVHINSRILIRIKTVPRPALKYDKYSMISRIWLFIFKTCSHSTKRDKRWLQYSQSILLSQISLAKADHIIINSVYCYDLLEFNETTEMTFGGGWQGSCWPFPTSFTHNIWTEVSDHFVQEGLKSPTIYIYIYSYGECSIKKTQAQHYFFQMFWSLISLVLFMGAKILNGLFMNQQGLSNNYLNKLCTWNASRLSLYYITVVYIIAFYRMTLENSSF